MERTDVKDLVALMPTRNRPENALKVYQAFQETANFEQTDLVAIVSSDDIRVGEYYGLPEEVHVWEVSPKRRGVVEPLNLGFQYLKEYSLKEKSPVPTAVMFLGDDHLPRTRGWDTQYLDVLSSLGTGMVYGNDLLQGEHLPTQIAMTYDIPCALEWFAMPGLEHLYCDTVWMNLGQMCGCIRYLPEVIFEHMHPGAGKASVDEGYAFSGDPGLDARDRATYEKYLTSVRILDDVATIKELR